MEVPVIQPMCTAHISAVSILADRLVGQGYYPTEFIAKTLNRATVGNRCTAYIATVDDQLVGFRIAFAPGRWSMGRGEGLTPSLWTHSLAHTAYFQTCFVDPAFMGRGIGGVLATRALVDLHSLGARAVVAHSWKESPHDSSRRYLARLGFSVVATHPQYWAGIDYLCSGCLTQPCGCTAIEMVLNLEPS